MQETVLLRCKMPTSPNFAFHMLRDVNDGIVQLFFFYLRTFLMLRALALVAGKDPCNHLVLAAA